MKIINITIISLVFLLGLLSATILSYSFEALESPFQINTGLNNGSAPSDFVKEDQIKIYQDRIVIYVNDASLSKYAATGSMKPVFDQGANGIRVEPSSENNINVGDLISFNNGERLVIHRVVEKGTDSKGVYFIPKGDNNSTTDGKIRFKDIRYITIGVIW